MPKQGPMKGSIFPPGRSKSRFQPSSRTVMSNRPREPSCQAVHENRPVKPSTKTVLPNRPPKPSSQTVHENRPVKPSTRTVLSNRPREPPRWSKVQGPDVLASPAPLPLRRRCGRCHHPRPCAPQPPEQPTPPRAAGDRRTAGPAGEGSKFGGAYFRGSKFSPGASKSGCKSEEQVFGGASKTCGAYVSPFFHTECTFPLCHDAFGHGFTGRFLCTVSQDGFGGRFGRTVLVDGLGGRFGRTALVDGLAGRFWWTV